MCCDSCRSIRVIGDTAIGRFDGAAASEAIR
jgi:hypothetical protein